MTGTGFGRALSLACAAALAAGMLGGCATTTETTEEQTEQQANRQYMSDVNEIMEDLAEQLESFTDAVSRDDVVAMRTQADDAFEVLDELDDLEAPDALADIHEDYVAGAAALEEALSAYVDLYTEIDAAGDSYDWDAYDEALAEIQAQYDEGIALLEEADETAASLE